MIDCIVRYYFETQQGRIIRFERTARFSAVPFAGSHLSLKDDNLEVEHVVFCEELPPILHVQKERIDEAQASDTIEEMKERGWCVESDVTRKTPNK